MRSRRARTLAGFAVAVCACAAAAAFLAPWLWRARREPQVPPVARCHARFEAIFPPGSLGMREPRDPYDPDVVAVDGRVTTPSGRTLTVPMFWLVPHEPYFETLPNEDRSRVCEWERFRPAGRGAWCLRLNPREPGRYGLDVLATRRGRTRVAWTGGFTAEPAASRGPHGPIQADPGGRYLRYASGEIFLPVGENLGWPEEAGSRIYAEWLRRLGAAGGNCGRLWLIHYMAGTTLEWTRKSENPSYEGLGRYNQPAGARVDRILDAAGENDVRLMLCFLSFGDFRDYPPWHWRYHPYNRANGGPLERPGEFFTDERARRAFRNRLRYAVARYGWSDQVWAWELWNEVETMDGYEEEAATRWHEEMAAYLKRIDAHGHMVTTSYRWTPPWSRNAAYELPDLDLAQAHSYRSDVLGALPVRIEELAGLGKPRLVGEFSIHTDPDFDLAGTDPAGLHVHDGLWVAPFAGAAGCGMTWWWERYIHPRDLYFHFTGVSRFFEGEDLRRFRPAECIFEVWTEPAPAGAWALASPERVLLWVASAREIDQSFDYGSLWYRLKRYARPELPAEAAIRIEGLAPPPEGTRPRAVFWDAVEGVPVSAAWARLDADGALRLRLPEFRESLAAKIEFVPEGAEVEEVRPPEAMPLRERFESLVPTARGAPEGSD